MNKINRILDTSSFAGSLIILECLLWGLGNPVTKIALEVVLPFYCLALRFSIAGIIFLIIFGKHIFYQLKTANMKHILIVSLFTALSFITCTFSLLLTSATIAGFLMSLAVIFTPFLSVIILKNKFNIANIPIVIIVVVGLFFLCNGNQGFHFGFGEIMALLSSVFLACVFVYTSKYSSNTDVITLSAMQTIITALISWICIAFFERSFSILTITATGWGAILYSAVACTFLAYIFQNFALKKVSAVFASLAFCSEPIFTAVFSRIILNERLNLLGWFGASLIIIGIVIASIYEKPSGEEEQASIKMEEPMEDKIIKQEIK